MNESRRLNKSKNESKNERGIAPDMPERYPSEVVRVKVASEKIDQLNKIIEAYDNLAIVSTVDAAQGELICWTTADCRPVLLKLLSKLKIVQEVE